MTKLHRNLVINYLYSQGKTKRYICRKYNISVDKLKDILHAKDEITKEVNRELVDKYMINIESRIFDK